MADQPSLYEGPQFALLGQALAVRMALVQLADFTLTKPDRDKFRQELNSQAERLPSLFKFSEGTPEEAKEALLGNCKASLEEIADHLDP